MSRLTKWLDRHNGRKLWEMPVRNVGTVTCYALGEGIALVLEYQNSGGWDIFVPASLDTDIDKTLMRAEEALRMTVHRCCDPDCPGYPYAASERAHPCGGPRVFEETRAAIGEMLGMDLDDDTVHEPEIPFMPPGWMVAQHFVDKMFFGLTKAGVVLAAFCETGDSYVVVAEFANAAEAAAYVAQRPRGTRLPRLRHR